MESRLLTREWLYAITGECYLDIFLFLFADLLVYSDYRQDIEGTENNERNEKGYLCYRTHNFMEEPHMKINEFISN